jgi:class 3 adenylate cyclase/predicted ATPase
LFLYLVLFDGDGNMKCSKCHHTNPQDAKFCMKCSTNLQRECPACGTELPENAFFCIKCGKKLDPKDDPTDSLQQAIVPDAERRQLTVMFCDIVDSSSLSEKLDPEDLREVIRKYQETCNKVISRFEGHIAQYLGDGLLVYFGYPKAHEDDAQRAARTGLAIVEAVSHLNPSLQEQLNIELSVRVGIHTGLVVTGEVGAGSSSEYLAIGDVPNIAARLQGEAAPNTVVVSETTHQLIEGYFACHEPENLVLKGFSQPLNVCQIDHVSTARQRIDPIMDRLTPIVGREKETKLLLERWERINEYTGQVVLLSGDAGIGKSRLVKVLEDHVAKDPQVWLTPCQCSAYHQNSALYPIIDLLERFVLQFEQEDNPEKKMNRLEGFLAQYGFALPEAVPVFCDLLSVPSGPQYPPSRLTPEGQKQLIFDTMLGVLLEIASRQPLLVVMEDLHWVDPTTLEFLNLLVDQIAISRIFALFTYRPNYNPSYRPRPYITPLMLRRLTREKSIDMIRHISGGKNLPAEVLEEILTKTDGVPLFVEELTKMVLESGLLREDVNEYLLTGRLHTLTIPVTLQDSLMARLDRLTTAKDLVQRCAILGREFTAEMLLAIEPHNEEMIQQGLSQLVESELLYQRGQFPKATYIFKHALIQETAYQSMLKSTRKKYHRQIADMLLKRFPELAVSQPEIIGHHYTEAEMGDVAISYWQQAGQRAADRFANEEAIAHLNRALEILTALPETVERAENELELLLAIGPSLIAIKGYAAEEVGQNYLRARTLGQEIGDVAQLFQVLWGLWGYYVVRSEHQEAREVGEKLLELARNEQDTIYLMESHLTLGGALFCLAEFVKASEHLEQGAALYEPDKHRSYISLFAADLGVFCPAWAAHPLWHIGYPDRAIMRSRQAVQLAEKLAHPYSIALALDYAAIAHQFRREAKEAYRSAEAAITICEEHNFAYYLGWAMVIKGWALADMGDCESGTDVIRRGLNTLRNTGAKRSFPFYLSLLAEVYGKKGMTNWGLQTLSEAFEEAENIEERWWLAELYRLQGALLLQQTNPDVEKAETSFHKAIEVARRQHSISLELRAATSLYRLSQQQSTRNDAAKFLVEVYNRFTEGFNTPDLKEAKGILNEIS